MKKPGGTYIINEFINPKEHPIIVLLNKYFEYHIEFDYIIKAKECLIQVNNELDNDKELLKMFDKYNFKRVV